MNRWYTRGNRPERNVEGALVGALLGYLHAVGKQKLRPELYALAGGLGSAMAMSEHRIANRAAANERNAQLAMAFADVAGAFAELRPSRQLR